MDFYYDITDIDCITYNESIYNNRPNTPLINISPRSDSPQCQTIEDYLRSGDLESIKVLFSSKPISDISISENLIIDCSKGLHELPYNKMTISGSILQGRFRAWRYIIERLDRVLTENELEAVIVVANSLYKNINWRHPFWTQISMNKGLNEYAKKWIKYRTN